VLSAERFLGWNFLLEVLAREELDFFLVMTNNSGMNRCSRYCKSQPSNLKLIITRWL
jgi:hypothetical protein